LQQAHGFVPEAFAELPFHLDHIVAPQHGGHREASNLAPPVVSATDTKGQTSPAFGLRLPFVKAAFPCCLVRRFFSPQFQKDDCFAFMELRHVRYFIGVAEEENVSRAALKLHVSQPALSRQIRDLEEELGFLLLERSAKSVRLTEAGRLFLAEARGSATRGGRSQGRSGHRQRRERRIARRICAIAHGANLAANLAQLSG
jgi:DNA-binding MarR family transcriptional regulator